MYHIAILTQIVNSLTTSEIEADTLPELTKELRDLAYEEDHIIFFKDWDPKLGEYVYTFTWILDDAAVTLTFGEAWAIISLSPVDIHDGTLAYFCASIINNHLKCRYNRLLGEAHPCLPRIYNHFLDYVFRGGTKQVGHSVKRIEDPFVDDIETELRYEAPLH